MTTPKYLSLIANQIESLASFNSSANRTDTGYWERIALAAEQIAGASTAANNNETGYMKRATAAICSACNFVSSIYTQQETGYLAKIIAALAAFQSLSAPAGSQEYQFYTLLNSWTPGGVGGLSAPAPTYPSPINSNPTTFKVALGADWQQGDTVKVAISASPSISSPTVLTHVPSDAEIIAGTSSINLAGQTLVAPAYLQAYGNHSGTDSSNKSPVVAWGDTTAPTITTSATQSNTETLPLAVALTATDTGGVPNVISRTINGVQMPGWRIDSGPDQLTFEIAIVSNVPTLRWINNGSQSASVKNDQTLANTYKVTVAAIDYSGNKTTLAITVTVNAADLDPNHQTFASITGATRSSTVVAAETWTVSGLDPVSAAVSVSGLSWSKNGGAYSTVSGSVVNGDTINVEILTTSASYETPTSGTITVGTYTTGFTVTTLADPANVSWVPENPPAGQNPANSTATCTFTNINFGVGMGVVFVGVDNSRTISSVTVGGVSATQVTSGTGGHNVSIWRANITSGGLKSVVVTASDVVNYMEIATGTMTPTSQTPAATATPKAYGYTADPQALASINVNANGIALCALISESPDNSITWGTGVQETAIKNGTTASGGSLLTTARLRATGAFSLTGLPFGGSAMAAAAWDK